MVRNAPNGVAWRQPALFAQCAKLLAVATILPREVEYVDFGYHGLAITAYFHLLTERLSRCHIDEREMILKRKAKKNAFATQRRLRHACTPGHAVMPLLMLFAGPPPFILMPRRLSFSHTSRRHFTPAHTACHGRAPRTACARFSTLSFIYDKCRWLNIRSRHDDATHSSLDIIITLGAENFYRNFTLLITLSDAS